MATSVNPYAAYLGDSTPDEVITQTATHVSQLVDQLGAQGLERSYAPGKWSARQIICHLADTEIAFAFRLRQASAEPHHIIQPFDQDAWSKNYSTISAVEAAQTFTTIRRWNLTFIKAAGTAMLSKPVTHPERGEMTFGTILQTMAGHDRNHLRQLETIAEKGD